MVAELWEVVVQEKKRLGRWRMVVETEGGWKKKRLKEVEVGGAGPGRSVRGKRKRRSLIAERTTSGLADHVTARAGSPSLPPWTRRLARQPLYWDFSVIQRLRTYFLGPSPTRDPNNHPLAHSNPLAAHGFHCNGRFG